MPHPRVLAYHLILTTYGFWLPNDPRGSWSDYVRSWELFLEGKATKTTETRSLAWEDHDVARRLAAKKALRYDPVSFSGAQPRCIGEGFKKAILESQYIVCALSILPKHVHAVIGAHAI